MNFKLPYVAHKSRFNSIQFLGRLSDFLAKEIESELKASGYGMLSTSHLEIITYLFKKKIPINMTTIAEEIHKKKPTVTILINKLENLNLVNKEASNVDKREYKISLTSDGIKFGKIALRISSKLFSLKLWGISPEESEQLYLLLRKVYSHIHFKP